MSQLFKTIELLDKDINITWVDIKDSKEKNNYTLKLIKEFFYEKPNAKVLIFVATRKRSEQFCDYLQTRGIVANFLHAGLSHETREKLINSFSHETAKVLVSTTALSMGLNLGVTHVIVADTHVPGKKLAKDEIIQMAGRARPNQGGKAVVLGKEPKNIRKPFLSSILLGFLEKPKNWNEIEMLHSVFRDDLFVLLTKVQQNRLVEKQNGKYNLTPCGMKVFSMGLDASKVCKWLGFWKRSGDFQAYNISDFRMVLHLLYPMVGCESLPKELGSSLLWQLSKGNKYKILETFGKRKGKLCVKKHPLEDNYLKLLDFCK